MDASIRLINPDAYLVNFFEVSDFQGKVYLDLDEQFQVRMTKVLEELTEANQIRQEAALSQSIPATPKNAMILERFTANVLNRNRTPIPVEVQHKGRRLPMDRIVVIKDSDRTRRIEIEMYGGSWIELLEEIRMDQIQLPDFEFNLPNIEATWADTTALAVAAPAHYGGFRTPGDITSQDCRFWFNLFKVMEQAFCQIGWNFESTFYQGAAGSRVYGYLSGEDWFRYEERNSQFRVDLNIDPARNLSGDNFPLLDEVSDPFDLYNNLAAPGTYLYPPAGEDTEMRIRITNMTITLEPHGGAGGQFGLVWIREYPLEFLDFDIRQGNATEQVTFTINKTIIVPVVEGGHRFTFSMGYNDDAGNPLDFTVQAEGIDFIPDGQFYEIGDTIPLGELLTDQANAADLYKAMSHIINGKTKTDVVSKTVHLFPAENHTQLNDDIEGFFQREAPPVILTDKVEPGSKESEWNDKERSRFVELKFKDAKDNYITDQANLPQEYNREIDTGSGKAQPTTYENDLFEPSMEALVDPADAGSTTAIGPRWIHLWDNTDGRQSRKLGPRVAFHNGLIEQQDNETSPTITNWTWEGVLRTTMPYLSQVSESAMVGDPGTVQLAFANFEKDLYYLHYRRWIQEEFSDLDIEFLIRLNYVDYRDLDFRRPIGIFYKTTFLLYQGRSIRDFDLRERTSTPVTLKLLEC